MRTRIKILLVVILTLVNVPIDAQTVRRIDPERLKVVEYPPLTEREGKDLTLPVPPPEHPRLFFRKPLRTRLGTFYRRVYNQNRRCKQISPVH